MQTKRGRKSDGNTPNNTGTNHRLLWTAAPSAMVSSIRPPGTFQPLGPACYCKVPYLLYLYLLRSTLPTEVPTSSTSVCQYLTLYSVDQPEESVVNGTNQFSPFPTPLDTSPSAGSIRLVYRWRERDSSKRTCVIPRETKNEVPRFRRGLMQTHRPSRRQR